MQWSRTAELRLVIDTRKIIHLEVGQNLALFAEDWRKQKTKGQDEGKKLEPPHRYKCNDQVEQNYSWSQKML